MGKEVEALAARAKHNIVCIVDSRNEWSDSGDLIATADVVIDFSFPEAVEENIIDCFDLGVPIVTGTTGWYDHLGQISKACIEGNHALFYASNFSIGMNIFFELNKHLAALMNSHSEYEAGVTETHHINKLDAPSGTAITIAKGMIEKLDRKKQWTNLPTHDKNNIFIKSIRDSDHCGTHVVSYHSEIDTIEIKHEAHNRKGFAIGALLAAEWIIGKKGVFSMKDLLQLNI
jgi:4-hydroxy-tetrahydrodipicolinate reductase